MILSYIAAAALVVLVVLCTQRQPLWALCLVMGSILLSYQLPYSGTPLYFLTELVLIPFAVVVMVGRKDPLRILRRSPFLAFVPFLGFLLLSALWASSPIGTVKEIVRWGDFVLLGFAATCVLENESHFDRIPSFLSWIGAFVAAVGISEFLLGINQNPYRLGARPFFGHPNPTAAFLSFCLLPALGLLIQERRSHFIKRIAVFLVLLLGLACTFSRGVFLACVVGMVFFLCDIVRSRRVENRRTAGILAAIFVTLGSLACISRFRQTAIERLIVGPIFSERQSIFAFGWTIYKERPWLGLGAGNLKTYALRHDLRVRPDEPFEPNYGDLHNLYLEIAVETGFIGLFLFLGGILYFGVIVARRKPLSPDSTESLYKSFWAATLTYLVANCSGFYVVKGINLEWSALLAVQAAMKQANHASRPFDGSRLVIAKDKLFRWFRKTELAFHHPGLVSRKIRQYYLRLTSFSLQPVLVQVYQNAESSARAKTVRLAKIYYGLDAKPSKTVREATDFRQRLFFARERLYRKGIRHDLGVWNIGFKDLKIQCASDSVLESMVYSDGFYDELTVLRVYESLLHKNDCVVDVGANIGVHALAMSRLVGDQGKVFAYEPNPAMVFRMQRNFQLNAVRNVEVRQTALGNMEGEIRFHDAALEFNQGLGRQDPRGDLNVPVMTMDKDLHTQGKPVALIKIDVEGMELRVVRGAHKILKRDHPAIVVEFNSPPWRLKELIAAIPFATRIFRIPDTLLETMRHIESQSDLFGFNNLLILPIETAKTLSVAPAPLHVARSRGNRSRNPA